MSMTAEHTQRAIHLGIEVRANRTSRAAAIKELVSIGMAQSSASGYLYVFNKMLDGAPYARTINLWSIRAFIDGIHKEYGPEPTRKAIHSVRTHVLYYSSKTGSTGNSTLEIIEAKQTELGLIEPQTARELALQTEVLAEDLGSLTDTELLTRAKRKPEGADKFVIEVTAFKRNPAVREYALRRANGKCEGCKSDAPFQTESNKAFLEVHHIIPLSEKGPDDVENAIALCPNCHRRAHFSNDKEAFTRQLTHQVIQHSQ